MNVLYNFNVVGFIRPHHNIVGFIIEVMRYGTQSCQTSRFGGRSPDFCALRGEVPALPLLKQILLLSYAFTLTTLYILEYII